MSVNMTFPFTAPGVLKRENASEQSLREKRLKMKLPSNFSLPSAKQSAVSFHSFPGNGAE